MSSVAPNPGYGQFLTPGQQPYQSIYKSSPSPNSSSNDYHSKTIDPHASSRTPSPTPSEVEELKKGAVDWRSMLNWRFWVRREWLWYYVALVIILVITALVAIYHTQIVNALTPVTHWLHDLKFGWLVPIGVLFVISFPPLFGHEIVAILCGLVWGLWIGFGIVAAGTFIGEVGNFYAFKYCCRARGEKLEKTKISYACLAQVVREGGFRIALIARLSAIPGHFTTAVFSTCGMNIFVFALAAILSLPKQFITVYLGVILEESNEGVTDTKSRIISDVVLAITFVITFVAMWYILREMNKAKPQVIYARRKARQGKQARAGYPPYGSEIGSASTITFNPNMSDSDIPLTTAMLDNGHERWDKNGNAFGYAGKSNIVAPKPQRLSSLTSGYDLNAVRMPRDVEEGQAYQRAPRESTSDEVGWDMGHTRAISDPYSESMDEDVTMLSSARPLKMAEYLTSSPPPLHSHTPSPSHIPQLLPPQSQSQPQLQLQPGYPPLVEPWIRPGISSSPTGSNPYISSSTGVAPSAAFSSYDSRPPSTNSFTQLPSGAAPGAFQTLAQPPSREVDARLQGFRAFSPPPPTSGVR